MTTAVYFRVLLSILIAQMWPLFFFQSCSNSSTVNYHHPQPRKLNLRGKKWGWGWVGCRGVECVHVTAQGIVIRRRLSRVMHAAENPIPPMSFPCCHAPSHIHVPTWVDVTVCKSPVSGVGFFFFFFGIHMFKTAQLSLSDALKLRWYQDQGSDGCEHSRIWTLIMTCFRGKTRPPSEQW